MEESWYILSNVEHSTSKWCQRNMSTNYCRHVALWWLTVTCSSDIQQWRVSSGIRCCVVTGCLLTVLRKVEFLFLGTWNLDDKGTVDPLRHQETLAQWNVMSQKTWILNSTAVRTQTSQGTSLLYTDTANKGFMKCGSWKFVAQICRTLEMCCDYSVQDITFVA